MQHRSSILAVLALSLVACASRQAPPTAESQATEPPASAPIAYRASLTGL